MKKLLFGLVVAFGLSSFGCVIVDSKPDLAATVKGATTQVTETIDRFDKIVTEADKGATVQPQTESTTANNIADVGSTGLKTVAPFLPPPWNTLATILATLIPTGAAWFTTKNKETKRTNENVFMIQSLQILKKENPDAFKKWVTARDKAKKASSVLKDVEKILAGIQEMKAKHIVDKIES